MTRTELLRPALVAFALGVVVGVILSGTSQARASREATIIPAPSPSYRDPVGPTGFPAMTADRTWSLPGAPDRQAFAGLDAPQPAGTASDCGQCSPATTPAEAAVRPGPEPHGQRRDTAASAISGVASHVGTRFGRKYLALPEHRWGRPGITVTITGVGGSVVRTSTDAGPSKAMQRLGRVADLNAWDFERVCGLPASAGLCRVTVDYGRIVLPQTDGEVHVP